MELFSSQLTCQNRADHRNLLMNFSSPFTLQTIHSVQLKPYRCMRIAQPLSELENQSLPFSCHGLGNTNQSPAVPLLGRCEHASRRLVSTHTFKAHSVRGAACSSAAWSGVTTSDILNAVDWSSETTFQQFCHREIKDRSTFGSTVLSSADASNLHVDMETEPSEM